MDSLRDAAAHAPLVTVEEEHRLVERAQSGDTGAAERLVVAHLRMALAESARLGLRGSAAEDALQAGAESLLRSLSRFDLRRGVRFSTFARAAVRAAVRAEAVRPAVAIGPVLVNDTTPAVETEFLEPHLHLLSLQDQRILAWRFGLDGQAARTQAEVAEALGVSRRRVRRWEAEAVAHLKDRLASVVHRAPAGADPL